MALFVVRHEHAPERCPATDPDMGAMLLAILSGVSWYLLPHIPLVWQISLGLAVVLFIIHSFRKSKSPAAEG